jgi:competence protein ComEA
MDTMEKLKPVLRWLAVGVAAIAVVFAYVAPHRPDASAVPDESPPPQPAVRSLDTAPPSAGPTPGMIAVYVCGAVRKSGVYRLASGARVVDAVNQAGGLAGNADAEAINLAEPLSDGMKIDVPKKGAAGALGAIDVGAVDLHGRPKTASHTHSSRHHSAGRSGSHKLQPGQTLNINTATEAELVALPGVGPGLARRIIEYREANGPFATTDDLQNVSGVGPSKFARMEQYIRV